MKSIVLLLAGLYLTGCSVGMALSGEEEKDVSFLREGTPRGIVQANLGIPDSTSKDTDSYKICKGDKPSVGRAIGHGIMDLLTLGLWEVVGTPIEGVGEGNECRLVTVLYDENDKLAEVK